ncbi:MAG TPA: hypothetical protein VJZ93_02985 [Candidatus Nanoarchaeia archaeon]|nr:hypothetical protein [Candidatus Nanoarchaeia archaeon]
MSGIILYSVHRRYFSFTSFDDVFYEGMKKDIISRTGEIIFCRKDVSSIQIDNARESIADTVRQLNNGEEIDVKKELSSYFN